MRAAGGQYTVRWEDVPPDGIDPGVYSLTWYYSARKDGSERKRMATLFQDDFRGGGFRTNWAPEGAFVFDWVLKRDSQLRRNVLSGPMDGRAVSRTGFPANSVVSVLARPDGLNGRVGLGLRTQERSGKAYWLKCDATSISLVRGEEVIRKQRVRPPLRLSSWYWFEMGLRNRKEKDVVIRVRIFDEAREHLIASVDDVEDKCPDRGLFRPGLLSLTGPALFAEVYVDPWAARWADDDDNQFIWSTSEVQDGLYYLFAEVADSDRRGRPAVIGSSFQVEVGRGGQVRND